MPTKILFRSRHTSGGDLTTNIQDRLKNSAYSRWTSSGWAYRDFRRERADRHDDPDFNVANAPLDDNKTFDMLD